VFTFDDDRSACPVDNLFHEDVSAFVSCPLSLPNVLVPEIPEYVFHHVFELEPGQVIENGHLR
jgi:hypothetical protein